MTTQDDRFDHMSESDDARGANALPDDANLSDDDLDDLNLASNRSDDDDDDQEYLDDADPEVSPGAAGSGI